ncbi:MAG: helix-turn-helix transcriptional regulator [Clostridiales bacterium]|nr:helix-turn-helix domain-containing protein [Roseburia sp.]MDD7635929.1 helix-turn-helix transcriptional regulator [Clostridiales bacterium]MDY4114168.1 helix-turn-helix transcriptional regulator [Roseburia sp.]
MQIGTRIQTLLTEQGIPQCRLAYDLHLNPNTINGYIKNRRLPDCFTLSQIAQYLGTNVDYLLGNTNIKVNPHLSLDEKEIQLLNDYRSMNQEQQHILEELSAALYAHGSAKESNSSTSLH